MYRREEMVEQFERAHFFRRMSEASSIADCGLWQADRRWGPCPHIEIPAWKNRGYRIDNTSAEDTFSQLGQWQCPLWHRDQVPRRNAPTLDALARRLRRGNLATTGQTIIAR